MNFGGLNEFRPLIRAILFIVRLKRDVASHHRRLRTIRRPTPKPQRKVGLGKAQNSDVWGRTVKLKRCESTRYHLTPHRVSVKNRHRNSAPTGLLFRTPTPTIEISGSFSQIGPIGNDSSVSRQSSIESVSERSHVAQQQQQQDDSVVRKIKHNTVNIVYGALTAVEQDDLDSLRAILSKKSFPRSTLDDLLENGLYANFSPKFTLLDIALALDRRRVAEHLLKNAARGNPELSDINKRRRTVALALGEIEGKLHELKSEGRNNKDEEKRARLLEAQLQILKQMNTHLRRDFLPEQLTNVQVEVSGSTQATIEFDPPAAESNGCLVTKYLVEWTKTKEGNNNQWKRMEVFDVSQNRISIGGLERGEEYIFRISAGSIGPYGQPASPSTSIRISSWSDLSDKSLPHPPEEHVKNAKDLFELQDCVLRMRQSTVWQRVFPSNPEGMAGRKKKSGLKYLFSASAKFVRNAHRGIYLATVIYTEGKVLCTVDDCLPVLCVDECSSSISAEDMHWLMKLSFCWDQVPYLQETTGWTNCSSNSPNSSLPCAKFLRAKLLDAVTSMHNALGVRDIGRVHHIPLCPPGGGTVLVTVHLVSENQTVQGLAMRWMRMEKLIRKKFSCSTIDHLCKEIIPILNFFESSQIGLDSGLYLCYLRLQSTVNTIHVLVPENAPSVLPFSAIRTNPHVSAEEWEYLRQMENTCSSSCEDDSPLLPSTPSREISAAPQFPPSIPTPVQLQFHQQISKAARTLVTDLGLDIDAVRHHRLFRLQVVKFGHDVSFILIMPKAEDVCKVSTACVSALIDELNNGEQQFRGCISLPVPVFQMISLSTYQPKFISTYCSLSVFLEHFTTVLQYEQRRCLLENDSKIFTELLERMNEFQQRLDEIWRSSRWISNITSAARDRQFNRGHSVPLMSILGRPASPATTFSDIGGPGMSSLKPNGIISSAVAGSTVPFQNGSLSRRSTRNSNNLRIRTTNNIIVPPSAEDNNFSSSPTLNNNNQLENQSETDRPTIDRSPGDFFKFTKRTTPPVLPAACGRFSEREHRTASCSSSPVSSRSLSHQPTSSLPGTPSPRLGALSLAGGCSSSVIRVFVAFECGLKSGISLRLKVVPSTTADEVVALVVDRVFKIDNSMNLTNGDNKIPMKNDDTASEDYSEYCLVSVVGARERRLRDCACIMSLSAPWNQGRLFVRHINCISAAIEYGNEAFV